MAASLWLVTCAVLAAAIAAGADSNETREFCPNLQSQKDFDLDELMRMWYVVEIMDHEETTSSAISKIDHCPVVHLLRLGSKHLKMLWEERAGLVEHRFTVPILYRPGYWVAELQPNSTLTDNRGNHVEVYFSGDVHVMKAVASHLVLTFCSKEERKLWTLVLSKENTLSSIELRGVNKMLERRGLQLSNVRQTCGSAAASAAATLTSLVLIAGVAALGLH